MTTGRRSNSTEATSFPSSTPFVAAGAAAAEELKPRGCRSSERRKRLAVAGDRDNMMGSTGRVRGPRRNNGDEGSLELAEGGRTLPKPWPRGPSPYGPQARNSFASLTLFLSFSFSPISLPQQLVIFFFYSTTCNIVITLVHQIVR